MLPKIDKTLIAKGILSWDGVERRTDRYGSFALDTKPFDGPDTAEVTHNMEAIWAFETRRVCITVKVVESRKSGHLGDKHHNIYPSQPKVGEVIDLGVGTFEVTPAWTGTPAFSLRPDDGRMSFWFDPRKLYRLHDQTVEVYAEETTDDFSAAPDIKAEIEPSAMHAEDTPEGAVMQIKGPWKEEGTRLHVEPRIERLGDGMFILDPLPLPGQRMKVTRR